MDGLFTQARPYVFHIELTDRCNAGCPMCPRTLQADHCRADKSVVIDAELTLDDFKTHFSPDLCQRIDQIVLSGNYGDPLAARDCLEICDYLTSHGVRLAISTNGGLRKPLWWQRLALILQRTNSRVELHVDGLADTNALYRVNTDFEKIMVNAAAFLEAGGAAEWHFIMFDHNQHQVEEAAALAREMGFSNFVVIDTVRFPKGGFDYQTPDGVRRTLRPPARKASEIPALGGAGLPEDETERARRERLSGAASGKGGNAINCKAMEMNRPYISARGQVSACCWVVNSDDERKIYKNAAIAPDRNNIRNRPLEEILGDEPFASMYAAGWAEDSLPVCQRKCGEMRRNRRHFA